MTTTELPIEAERYLANLGEGLRTMPRHERESLILELRSHFEALGQRGGAAGVDKGIADLGPAQRLAAEFVAARGAGPIAISVAPVPAGAPPSPFTLRALVRDALATIAGADERLRVAAAVLLATIAATNFMAFLGAHHPEAAFPKPLTLALRVAGLLFALVATYRIMLPGPARPWRFDRPLLNFVGGGLALLTIVVACQLAVGRALVPWAAAALGLAGGAALALKIGAGALTSIGCVLALLRFQPWVVALATGRGGLTPLGSWRAMRGKTALLFGGWLLLVLPLFAAHYAISSYAVTFAPGRLLLPLAAVDGLVATAQALLVSALLVTAYRWVSDQAAPAPAPFAAVEPSREAIAVARRMLLDALDARYEAQMHPHRHAR